MSAISDKGGLEAVSPKKKKVVLHSIKHTLYIPSLLAP